MVSLKRIQEINKEIEEITDVGLSFFVREFDKFEEKLSDAIEKYGEESAKINKALAEKSRVFDEYEKKLKEVKKEYTIYKRKVEGLNRRSKENTEKEDELLKLHKILVNKGKSLKAKEADLNEKERRLNDR